MDNFITIEFFIPQSKVFLYSLQNNSILNYKKIYIGKVIDLNYYTKELVRVTAIIKSKYIKKITKLLFKNIISIAKKGRKKKNEKINI